MRINQKLAALSLLLGAAGYFSPYLLPRPHLEEQVVIGLCLAIVWAGVFVSCVVRFGKSGLWFLVGAPLALYSPFLFFMLLRLVVA
jgi:hypothetical protein